MDRHYQPTFKPWSVSNTDFLNAYHSVLGHTVVDIKRCWLLWAAAKQCSMLGGEIWECGVYKGGTAVLLADAVPDRKLRLFDSFEGLPEPSEHDAHISGLFADTSLKQVEKLLGDRLADIRVGLIPDTFKGLEDAVISFAHVDVDMYQSVRDCCEFIWPRLKVSGMMVFDDYGFPCCLGAKKAVDEFFVGKAVPLCLESGHALVVKPETT